MVIFFGLFNAMVAQRLREKLDEIEVLKTRINGRRGEAREI